MPDIQVPLIYVVIGGVAELVVVALLFVLFLKPKKQSAVAPLPNIRAEFVDELSALAARLKRLLNAPPTKTRTAEEAREFQAEANSALEAVSAANAELKRLDIEVYSGQLDSRLLRWLRSYLAIVAPALRYGGVLVARQEAARFLSTKPPPNL